MDAALLIGSGVEATCKETRESVRIKRGLGAVLAMSMDLMIVPPHDPRWRRGLARRTVRSDYREGACPALLTNRFSATVDRQAVRLEIDFTDVSPLNQWLPFVKRLSAPLHWPCRRLARGSTRASSYVPADTILLPCVQPALRRRGCRAPAGAKR